MSNDHDVVKWTALTEASEHFDTEQRLNSAPPVVDIEPYRQPEPKPNLKMYHVADMLDVEALFVQRFAGKYRYSAERGGWLVFHAKDDPDFNVKASYRWEWDTGNDHIEEDIKRFAKELPFILDPPIVPKDKVTTAEERAQWSRYDALMESLKNRNDFAVSSKQVEKKVAKKGGAKGEKETITETVVYVPLDEAKSEAIKVSKFLANSWGARQHFEHALRTNPYLSVPLSVFDSHPEELNTPGGLYNLRTLSVSPVGPWNTVKRSTSYAPTFDTPTPLYDDLLSQAFAGDQSLMDYFDNCMGATLLGGQYLQQFFMLQGAPGSGKGTLMLLATEILGKADKEGYAATIDSDMLTGRKDHPTQNMQFLNARMVFADELPEGSRLDSTLIKKNTGGADITGRYMRQDNMSFKATHNLWVTSNFKIHIDHDDDGMWRRARILHTPYGITAGKRVSRLDLVIANAEGGAVLGRWIKAAHNYLNSGYLTPQTVMDEMAEYKASQNSVEQWIRSTCTVHFEGADSKETFVPEDATPDRNVYVLRSAARKSYRQWCKDEGFPVVSAEVMAETVARVLGEDAVGRLSGSASNGNRDRVFFGLKIDSTIDLHL